MADLVKYPIDVLHAVYQTHRYADLEKLVNQIERGQRRFQGEDVVLAVKIELWDHEGRRIRLYQQERQVLRAIYVLAHQQNSAIVEFTPAQLMEVLGYAQINGNDFSPTVRQRVMRALGNLFGIHVEVEMQLGSGGKRKIYGHFLDSYAVDTDREGKIRKYAVQINVLIGLDLSRFKLMPADLPRLITRHGPDQAVTTFADFCLIWEGQTVDWGLDTWVERLQLDPARRTRNMQIIERCARWGVDNGLVLSWKKSRMRQDKRRVKYTMTITPQRYRGKSPVAEDGQEGGRAPVERFYELLGARASERKLTQDAAVAESLLAEGFRPEDLTFAVEWAIAHIPKVKSFGLIPYIMHQALQARDDAQHAEEAQREAEARIDEQLHQEREEQDRRRRLAELRASLPVETLAALQHRAEEALAADGVDRTHLGYDMLVKLKIDELLEWESLLAPARDDCHTLDTVVAAAGTCEGAGLTRPPGASDGPVIAEPVANTFGGPPMATIPEIEARIHALWTKGEARTREESAELGRLLTALEAEQPPGDFYTHVLEVLHIPARDAQRFMQQSRASQGAAPEESRG
jgi:hypothetical protein